MNYQFPLSHFFNCYCSDCICMGSSQKNTKIILFINMQVSSLNNPIIPSDVILKKNREKFYYNKTGIDIQNPVTPERSYEIPFELKRSVPTHISREVLLHITGFTSDQRIERKFSFLMTDKASVKNL